MILAFNLNQTLSEALKSTNKSISIYSKKRSKNVFGKVSRKSLKNYTQSKVIYLHLSNNLEWMFDVCFIVSYNKLIS